MSEPSGGTQRYRVSYSGRVREELAGLAARADALGRRREILAAVMEIDWRLRVYPQFGQPLRDLQLQPAQLWIGVVPPLVVHYLLDEERRVVFVGLPIQMMSRPGE